MGEGQGEGIFEGADLGVRPQHREHGMPFSPAGTHLPDEPLFLYGQSQLWTISMPFAYNEMNDVREIRMGRSAA